MAFVTGGVEIIFNMIEMNRKKSKFKVHGPTSFPRTKVKVKFKRIFEGLGPSFKGV